jgi:general secretion pathway protein I
MISRGQPRAFTLLEVMVALGLLAGALVATSDLAGAALRNHEQARELNAAVLLARARMASIEERYEDLGFKDQDEDDSGDFADDGRPDVRWKLEVLRPAPNLSADQLLAMLAGASGAADAADLATRLLGPQAGKGGAPVGTGPKTDTGPALALATTMLQAQLTAFGEVLKKSVREVRLTVSWAAGQRTRGFTVTTHLVVLNPKAPGGARGDWPDVPPSVAASAAAAAAVRAAVPPAAPPAAPPKGN